MSRRRKPRVVKKKASRAAAAAALRRRKPRVVRASRAAAVAPGPAALPPIVDVPGADELIARFALEPHPEGGWYRETFRSRTIAVTRYPDGAPRGGLTTILYLLKRGERSRWHRVASDESWHFHGGAALELLTIEEQAGAPTTLPHETARAGAAWARIESHRLDEREPVLGIPARTWQAARTTGEWSLLSCSVGPGFDFADFELLDSVPPGERPVIPEGAVRELFERMR